MLPHSSHLLQPLDVSCFSVLKRSYGREIEQLMRASYNYIDKSDFLIAYLIARRETMAIDTVRNRFVGTGLVPYDPERVLSKLNTQLRTPIPPPAPIEQEWVPETPRNPADLELQVQAIKEKIQRRTTILSSPTETTFQQLVKGYQLAMYSATILAEENRKLRSENERQKKKRATRRQYITTGGILIVREGIRRVQAYQQAIDQVQIDNIALVEGITTPLEQLQTRTLRMYSICRSLVHTARTCPERI